MQPIELRPSVKQGNPMSPLLFNLSIDLLLWLLEREGAGPIVAMPNGCLMAGARYEGISPRASTGEIICLAGP